MRRLPLDLLAVLCVGVLGWLLWTEGWPFLKQQLRGTWAWDLRQLVGIAALLAVLSIAERIGGAIHGALVDRRR